jgi:hypothetical protein
MPVPSNAAFCRYIKELAHVYMNCTDADRQGQEHETGY